MKIFYKTLFIALIAATAGITILINGCKKEATPLSDSEPPTMPRPIVDSISPAGSALAGIDTVTIYGKNFSPNRANDGIYFNATLINNTAIISASPTKLVFVPPVISGDSIRVRVYVIGAEDFSPTVLYKLYAVITPFSKLASGESAYGVCIGSDDSLYVSLFNANLSVKDEGIFKITADGTINPNPVVKPTTNPINSYWSSIKMGNDGNFYATLSAKRVVYKLVPGIANPGGITANYITAFSPVPTGFNDLDFDPNHFLWVGGNPKNIYRVNISDKSTKSFLFDGNVKAVRYFNGYLYFAAAVTGGNKVFRAPIVADTLGTPEVYFDISTAYTGSVPNILAITFSADGDMYVGIDAQDYLIVVHPGGGVEKPYSAYISGGFLTSGCKSFAWNGTTLYTSTTGGALLKVAPVKQGAPNY